MNHEWVDEILHSWKTAKQKPRLTTGYPHSRIISITFFVIFVLVSWTIQARSLDGNKLDLLAGWNLISLPCSTSVEEIRQKSGLENITFYGWDGSDFSVAEQLTLGEAYYIRSSASMSIESPCVESLLSPDSFQPILFSGWNLIGAPYLEAVTFSDVFPRNVLNGISSIVTFYDGDFIDIFKSGGMYPNQGYWIYYTGEKSCEPVCSTDADCDDNFEITTDRCQNANNCSARCWHTPAQSTCTDPGCARPCADGTISYTGACPDYWLYFEPLQCVREPWGYSIEHLNSDDFLTHVNDSFGKSNGITILDVRTCFLRDGTPLDCVSATGYMISIHVSNDDAVVLMYNNLLPDINVPYGRLTGVNPVPAYMNPSACLPGECLLDEDCNDSNPGTTDQCIVENRKSSYCENLY